MEIESRKLLFFAVLIKPLLTRFESASPVPKGVTGPYPDQQLQAYQPPQGQIYQPTQTPTTVAKSQSIKDIKFTNSKINIFFDPSDSSLPDIQGVEFENSIVNVFRAEDLVNHPARVYGAISASRGDPLPLPTNSAPTYLLDASTTTGKVFDEQSDDGEDLYEVAKLLKNSKIKWSRVGRDQRRFVPSGLRNNE
jgi:hypothetical protein